MEKVYDWGTNILSVNDKLGNKYYLELRGDKNIVKGCSGSGKSFLVDRLSKLKKNTLGISEYDVSNIVVLSVDNIDKLKDYKNVLIIIDNAEVLLTGEDIDIINNDINNRYLVFTRVPLGIGVSPNHHADLVTENGVTKMSCRFNITE